MDFVEVRLNQWSLYVISNSASSHNNQKRLNHLAFHQTHQQTTRNLHQLLSCKRSSASQLQCHNFLPIRFKSFQVVLMLCRLRPQYSFNQNKKSQPPLLGMVGLAIALPPPSVHEIRLECDMFVTRINFDFRIAHCEPK
jgi:hypothetical protein